MGPKKQPKNVEDDIPSTAHRDGLREAILAQITTTTTTTTSSSSTNNPNNNETSQLANLLRSQRENNAALWQEITELHDEAAAIRRETNQQTSNDSDSDSDTNEVEALLQLEQALQAELALLNDPNNDDELADHLLESIRENAAIANDPETQEENHLQELDELEQAEVSLRREIRQLDPSNDHGGDKELWEIVTNPGAAKKRTKQNPPSMRNNLLMELEEAVTQTISPQPPTPSTSQPTHEFLLSALNSIAVRPTPPSTSTSNTSSTNPLGPLSSPTPSHPPSSPPLPTRPLVNAILQILAGTIVSLNSNNPGILISDIASAIDLQNDPETTVQAVVDELCKLGVLSRLSRSSVKITHE